MSIGSIHACRETLLEKTFVITYPKLQVAHSINYTKCLTSSNASVDPASIEFHEKALSHRTKPIEVKRNHCHTIKWLYFSIQVTIKQVGAETHSDVKDDYANQNCKYM